MVVVLDFLVVPEHLEIEKRTIHHLLHQHKDILVEMEEVAVTEVLEAAVEQEERVLITLETHQTLVELDLHPQLMAALQLALLVALVVVMVVNQRVLVLLQTLDLVVVEVVVLEMQGEAADLVLL